MPNPFREDTVAYNLYEAGEQINSEAKDIDESINATDRRTAAIYKVGAAVASGLEDLNAAYSIAEDIGMDLTRLGESIEEIAKSIKGAGSN